LVPPWGEITARRSRGNVLLQVGEFHGQQSLGPLREFVFERTDLHKTYVLETQKTKRVGLYLAAALIGLACLIPVFAPEGREIISYGLAMTLFVFGAGSMGFTTIKLAAKKRKIAISKGASDA
jgi:hypothetical protein